MSEVSIQPEANHSPKMGEFLNHHGIKGMKWGVRRTPEQLGHVTARKRTGGESKSTKKVPAKKTPGKSARSSSFLSDDELQKRINRLSMEEKYDELVARKNARNNNGVGAWVKDALVKQGKRFGESMVGWAFDKAFERITKGKENELSINDFRNIDVSKMDANTLSKVATMYENAFKISQKRENIATRDFSEGKKDEQSSKKTSNISDKPKNSPPEPATSKPSTKSKDSAPKPASSKPSTDYDTRRPPRGDNRSSSRRPSRKQLDEWIRYRNRAMRDLNR